MNDIFMVDDDKPTPRARRTDPATSHMAAASVTNLRQSHEAVLSVLRGVVIEGEYGLTDEELVAWYNTWQPYHNLPKQSPSGIRTRRRELADMKPPRVEDTGKTRQLESGRKAIVWRAI